MGGGQEARALQAAGCEQWASVGHACKVTQRGAIALPLHAHVLQASRPRWHCGCSLLQMCNVRRPHRMWARCSRRLYFGRLKRLAVHGAAEALVLVHGPGPAVRGVLPLLWQAGAPRCFPALQPRIKSLWPPDQWFSVAGGAGGSHGPRATFPAILASR